MIVTFHMQTINKRAMQYKTVCNWYTVSYQNSAKHFINEEDTFFKEKV